MVSDNSRHQLEQGRSGWVQGETSPLGQPGQDQAAGGAGQTLSLEAFKTWQDKALSSLGWPCSWSCLEQDSGLEAS